MFIYITIAILPLYFQEILGYTAFAAGLVVGPRGVGSFVGSPLIGYLGSRINPRKLLTAGFIGFGVCSLIFGTVNLEIGPASLLVPILLTGFALSFVLRFAGDAAIVGDWARATQEKSAATKRANVFWVGIYEVSGEDCGAGPGRGPVRFSTSKVIWLTILLKRTVGRRLERGGGERVADPPRARLRIRPNGATQSISLKGTNRRAFSSYSSM